MTALCVFPSCVRCHRCEAAEEAQARDRRELEGLRATVAAIEAACNGSDLVVARMCRAARRGEYPTEGMAA